MDTTFVQRFKDGSRALRSGARRAVVLGAVLVSAGVAAPGCAPGTRDGAGAPDGATLAAPALATAESRAAMLDDDLSELFDDYDRWQQAEYPSVAIRRGDRTAIARLPDGSIDAEARRARARDAFRARLDAIDQSRLGPRDRMSCAILATNLDAADHWYRHREYLMPVDPLWGVHQTVGNLAAALPIDRPEDFERYLTRLAAVPAWVADAVARMRVGLREGRTPPRVILQGVPEQVDVLLAPGGLDELRAPFARLRGVVPDATAAEMTQRLERTLLPAIRAALEDYRTFLAETYVPGCRESIAAIDFPDGVDWYGGRLVRETTTTLTPEAIHELGLNEVARIRSEMLAVIERTDFLERRPDLASADDDTRFAAFVSYLRTGDRFYVQTPDELLRRYRDICKRIDGKLPPLFRVLPRLPYGVEPIPDFLAPRQTTAYYQPGSLEAGVPGTFFANTYRLDQRPTYEMIPLSLHEAVPGHHLQIALAQELDTLPAFRRDARFTGYLEGWALYAERLGIEMQLFEDPYDDFGRLLFEMWRACRLVVDPGMHALGWSRDQARDFLRTNTALSEVNIAAEVDRYIAWPGQATAYKIGELRIRALRRKAEARLGDAFDVRTFHQVLLGEGALPLDALDAHVDRWLDGLPQARAFD